MIYRRYDIEVPKAADERFRETLEIEIKAGRLPADVSYHDMVLQLFLRGLEDLRAQQRARERAGSLVLTPQEIAESQERLRSIKRE